MHQPSPLTPQPGKPSASSSTQQLLDTVKSVRRNHLAGAAAAAADYNIFRVLGVESKEVDTHSAFLAHLLDPAAAHSQGPLFLQSFLRNILDLEAETADQDWTIETEWVTFKGRIDILLQSKARGIIIAIENKIYASEGENQLKNYRDWLDSGHIKASFPKRRELLYLTPDGRESCDAGSQDIDYRCISYREDIAKVLEATVPDIKAPPVEHSVRQYLETLKEITSEQLMETQLDREIMDVLSAPENIATALAVARCAERLRHKLLADFWARGQKYLEKELAEQAAKWTIVVHGNPESQKSGLRIVPKENANGGICASFHFFQYRSKNVFRWERCVNFNNWLGGEDLREQIASLPEAKKLNTALKTFGMEPKHGWDGYLRITKDAVGIDRVLEEEARDGRYSGQLFEEGFATFLQLESLMRKLNTAISKMPMTK